MAKKNTTATPAEPEAPRPPEPPAPAPACPVEDELARQALALARQALADREALARVRRLLIDREPLTDVYGDGWYLAAQSDLFRVAVFGAFRNHAKTQNYLLAFMDGLTAAKYPSLRLAPPRVKLDPPVERPVGTKRKGYRPAPGRSVLDI